MEQPTTIDQTIEYIRQTVPADFKEYIETLKSDLLDIYTHPQRTPGKSEIDVMETVFETAMTLGMFPEGIDEGLAEKFKKACGVYNLGKHRMDPEDPAVMLGHLIYASKHFLRNLEIMDRLEREFGVETQNEREIHTFVAIDHEVRWQYEGNEDSFFEDLIASTDTTADFATRLQSLVNQNYTKQMAKFNVKRNIG